MAFNENGPDSARKSMKSRWRDALEVYAHKEVPPLLFLGFSAGLPLLLVFSTLTAWLNDEELSKAGIGFFAWVGITYSIKVIWAPVVDRLPIFGLTRLLGRRRSWMLLAQLGVVAGLILMAVTDPKMSIALFAFWAVLVAFSSATQDVALDAYRIECAPQELQGALAAAYQLGYRLALLVAGAGALFIADGFSWPIAYFAMAACMLVGMITVLLVKEPEQNAEALAAREKIWEEAMTRAGEDAGTMEKIGAWFLSAVVGPFYDFFTRFGWLAFLILAFIGLFRLSDLTMGIMANPFYLDLGFTKTQIAEVAKLYGFVMTILGAALGGFFVARYGLKIPLLIGAVAVAVTNVFFAYLASVGPVIDWLIVTISADNLAGGFAGTVLIAYLSSLTSMAYTATQYALFSSFMTLPGKFISGFSGIIVQDHGYIWFFIYAAVLGIPAIVLVIALFYAEPYIRHRSERLAAAEQARLPAGAE